MKDTILKNIQLFVMVTIDTDLIPLTKDGKDLLKKFKTIKKVLNDHKKRGTLYLHSSITLFVRDDKSIQGYLFTVLKKSESNKVMPKDVVKTMDFLRTKSRNMILTSLSIDTDMIPIFNGDKKKIKKHIENEIHGFVTDIKVE